MIYYITIVVSIEQYELYTVTSPINIIFMVKIKL